MHSNSRLSAIVMLLVVVFATFFFGRTLPANAAGFRVLFHDGVEIGVWYPSDTATTSQRLGPFEVDVARDAPIKKGTHQVILFSHGNGGYYRNHYLTAHTLADAGFIVAAPQHEADYLIGGRKTASALNHRYLELDVALKAVLSEADFRGYVDDDVIHGLGYSLGGATILLAAGAEYSTERVVQHCRLNKVADAGFCAYSGWIHRITQFFRSFRHNVSLPETTDPFRNKPLTNGKIVLVAPAFQGLRVGESLSAASLTVFAIEGDRITKPEFHARPLVSAVSPHLSANLQSIPGHHYAFIAPFPKWLTDKEDIPVAFDPEGFDRQSFLTDMNARILSVFLTK